MAADERVELGLGITHGPVRFDVSVKLPNPFRQRGQRESLARLSDARLRKQGRRQGRQDATFGFPPQNHGPQYTGFEESVVKQRDERNSLFSEFHRAAIERVQDFFDNWKLNALEKGRTKEKIQGQIENRVRSGCDEIIDADKDERSEQARLEEFQEAHKEQLKGRKAAEDLLFIRAFVFFVIIIAVESLLNGALFSGASSYGLLGGVTTALGLSAVNVGLGLANGQAIRFFSYKNETYRRISWGVSALIFLLALLFNIFVAHYRDFVEEASRALSSANPDVWVDAGVLGNIQPALNSMRHDFLGIHSVAGMLLALLGAIAFGLTTWESYRGFEDPYPGYSRRWDAHRRAKRSADDLRRKLRDQCTAYSVRATNALEWRQSIENLAIGLVGRAWTWLEHVHGAVTERLTLEDGRANIAVRAYRDENEKRRKKFARVRKDPSLADVPAYFRESLRQTKITIPSIEKIKTQYEGQKTIYEANLADIEQTLSWLSGYMKNFEKTLRDVISERHAQQESNNVIAMSGRRRAA